MKLQRYGLVAGLVVGVLALRACGSDNNDSSSSAGGGSSASGTAPAGSIDCASGTLSWDG